MAGEAKEVLVGALAPDVAGGLFHEEAELGCFGADGVEAQPRGEVTKHVEHVSAWE